MCLPDRIPIGAVRANHRHEGHQTGVGARCEKTEAAAGIETNAATLGGLCLGGRTARAVALTGAISSSGEAVDLLDSILLTSPAPWRPEIF